MLSSLDDSAINYSSANTDWRAKYNEVADMLAETRADLDDFHHASKELEAELESELQRTEKAQQDLKVKVARAESERDDWKNKFMSLQTTHNSTTTSLQRELDKLRQEHQQVKVQLRELEMGNDDLERTERAISSNLADVEAKYSRALEEKIILEHELFDKANLEEQCQRLKDELRDANAEVAILKDQLATRITQTEPFPNLSSSSYDNLLKTPPPADLSLSELGPSSDSLPDSLTSEEESTPRKRIIPHQGPQHTALLTTKSSLSTPPNLSAMPRSNTLPSMYNSPRTPVTRPTTLRNPSSMSTTSNASATSKSKGVQMVSEMRARVKNLEQKIHTRVPRLRMGSTSKTNSNSVTTPVTGSNTTSFGRSTAGKSSWENPLASRKSVEQKRPNGLLDRKDNGGDSTGWVLIMEDSPSPPRDRRRASSPSDAVAFRPTASRSSGSPTLGNKASPLSQSTMQTGIRRPQSRLSAGSTTTTSSIPTPTSRPATPTFLPIPTSTSTSFKRSIGPGVPKRSSLGSSAAMPPPSIIPRERPTTMPPHLRPNSGDVSPDLDEKALPNVPIHQNITIRTSKLPPSTSSSLLSQSRIGRPSGGVRRRSTDDTGRS